VSKTRDDLSGAWQGLFHYPHSQPPTAFRADLTDAAGWLKGATSEEGAVGPAAGRTITATLSGRRTDGKVTFLKTYDVEDFAYDVVAYEGVVSEDGLEIEGVWRVPGSWSGRFLMIRAEGAEASAEAEASVRA
jgi:hypothetical protein